MRREDLQKIALDEARKALGVTDIPDLKFERRGGLEEWDEGICKNVYEANFRVWESVAVVDTELDAKTGDVLQVAYRRSDLIESIHDGSFFHDRAKLWAFLPTALILGLLWGSGIYLFVLPHHAKWKRRRTKARIDNQDRPC